MEFFCWISCLLLASVGEAGEGELVRSVDARVNLEVVWLVFGRDDAVADEEVLQMSVRKSDRDAVYPRSVRRCNLA